MSMVTFWPCPRENKSKYIEIAESLLPCSKTTGLFENWADDVPEGKVTSLPMAVRCEDHEAVVFSWITWPSREGRDAGNKAAMADPRFSDWDPGNMPFDGKRMIFGGFTTIVDA